MPEDSRATKHPRFSTNPNPPVILAHGEPSNPKNGRETFTRHADFWLEDSNLILLAGKAAFCILRSILVNKSAVFADMFATGSPDATESFDGCPVVRLSDHPEDLQDFLQYLMPCSPLKTRFPGIPTSDFSELHAAVHLAHKYQCPDVEACVLSVLRNYYAPNFYTAAIMAVNIARLTNTSTMLPFALYLTCSTEPGRIVDGYARRDGSVEHLSAKDLKACIGARSELAWMLAGLVGRVFTPTCSVGCRRAARCTVARQTILEEVEICTRGRCDALEPFCGPIGDWASEFGLCKVCKREMLAREVKERRRIWERLPGLFGVTDEATRYAFTSWDGESSSDSNDSD